ncbi:hypothetical protein NDA14_006796 [Ustilago hordei]|nr:hypothetical protein NDA14_006796 [Ustilago hordei]
MPSFPQQYDYVDSGRFHYGYDREEYPHYEQQHDNGGVMSPCVQPHSRTISRPRVGMACEHCRKSRKVRCDGKQPSCGLCSRLAHVTCVYVKVTPEQNASGTYRSGAGFSSSVIDDINTQRASGIPNAPALPQTGTVLQSNQPQQPSSGYFYDGRYQAAPGTSTGANAIFNVGAGIKGSSRRPSVMAPYARKQSFEAASVITTAGVAGGLNILTPHLNTNTTSYYTNSTFRTPITEPQPERSMSAFTPPPCLVEYQTSSPIHTPTATPTRPQSALLAHHQQQCLSCSPTTTATSPSYLTNLPSLERAPSRTDSCSVASPETSPHHAEDSATVWGGEQKKQYWGGSQQNWDSQAAAAGEEVASWASQVNPGGNGKAWDPVVSHYLQQPSHSPI